MKKVSVNTRIKDIMEDEVFKDYVHMINYQREHLDESEYELTLQEFQDNIIGWSAVKMAEGLSYLYEKADKGQVFYSFYSEEEKALNPDLKETGLAFFPSDQKSRFIVICPGGGYEAVSSTAEAYPITKDLNDLGYSVFVVSYRVGKKGRCPKPVDDLARAIGFILKNAEKFDIESENYCVVGFSAGAHLVSTWGTNENGYKKYNLPKPGLLGLCYPVITMGEFAHQGSKNNLLGSGADDPELIRRYSTELNVTRDYPATFMWQCDGDSTVSLENSIQMALALRKHDVPNAYEVYHYSSHGLKDYAQAYPHDWHRRMCAFWEETVS